MKYEEFSEYLTEHWDNVVDIFESSLTDKAMKGLIKFSQSDNPISKGMRKRGMNQAMKYTNKKRPKLKRELDKIASEIVDIVLVGVEKNGGEIKNINVGPGKNEDTVIVKIKYRGKYNVDKTVDKISDYLVKYRAKNPDIMYDYWFNEDSCNFTAKIEL